MDNARFIDELASKLNKLLARTPAAEMEKNLRAILSSAFAKLDLVTREEFEVQREVLLRTRDKLAELEAKLAALEAQSVSSAAAAEPRDGA